MTCAYNCAPGRRGGSTQIVIDGIAACVAIGVTKEAPNKAVVATTSKACFLFKVFSPFVADPPIEGEVASWEEVRG